MTDRTRQARSVLAGALLALPLLTTPALAAPVSVNLRVEGKTDTIFEGPVTTDGHDVTTPTGGTHKCDGTNGGAEPSPGPTALGALDDASRLGAFTWDGNYGNFGIDDYFVDRVQSDTADPNSEFWALFIDVAFAEKGGCQQRVHQGEEVLWAFAPFSIERALRLTGPADVDTNQPATVRVTDGGTGDPQQGATVNGTPTGANGNATLTFPTAGIYRLKAEQPNAIRSKALVLCVDPPQADACTSTDKSAPGLTVSTPGSLASAGSRSRTILISWQGDDRTDGSGIRHYGVDVREVSDGARASQNDWQVLRNGIARPAVHFRGDSGSAYEFRVRATDRANNIGDRVTAPVVIPVDDRDRRLLRLRGWQRLKRSNAWGRTVVRAKRKGAVARLTFTGGRVALIGRKLRKGGRVRLSVGGRSKVVSLRGRPKHRSVLYTTAPLKPGRHTLRVTALGGGPVELDAVAPMP